MKPEEPFFNIKLKDFSQTTIKALISAYEPYVIISKAGDRVETFSGFEVDILRTITDSLNAKLSIDSLPLGFEFMSAISNVTGVPLGSTDFLQNGVYDLSFGSYGIFGVAFNGFVQRSSDPSVFTCQWQDSLVSGIPPPVKRRDTLVRPFQLEVWGALVLTTMLSLLLFAGYIWLYQNRHKVHDR